MIFCACVCSVHHRGKVGGKQMVQRYTWVWQLGVATAQKPKFEQTISVRNLVALRKFMRAFW